MTLAAEADGFVERLFSYGTLQRDEVQMATFGRLLAGVTDGLPCFAHAALPIDDPEVRRTLGQSHYAIARFTGDPVDVVPGVVFHLTAAELESADAYEVEPYIRVRVTLISGTLAWTYVDGRDRASAT
ncbi:MAG TPA: gamma-glutamylcyclotransferase [Gemmatimonas sp.]|nr:gamma-glutamylcyclotransferase [Gemmatimonas sp.]